MKKNRPTLFCVHGGPGLDRQSLLPGITSLETQFNLVFVDLRWDGASSVESYASQVCEVVQKTAPSSPIGIFGHSFGGHVAMEALASAPAFFDFGILCATFCNAADWFEYISYTSKLLHHPSAAEIEAHYNQSLKTDDDFKEMMLAYAPLYFPELSVEAARDIMKKWNYFAAPYNDAVANIYAKIDMTQRCRRIMAKCLVIGGGQDKIVPPDEPDKLAKLIHNATAAIIDDAGHFPFLTKPNEFQRVVEQYFTSAGLLRDA